MIISNIKSLITYKTDSISPEPQKFSNISIKIDNGKIVDIDRFHRLKGKREKDEVIIEAKNKAVIPGLVECHTHLLFGGDRIDDFERRSRGISYLQILKAGGGINHTVKCTREEPDDKLFMSAMFRVMKFHSYGITTLEIKSGYGLSTSEEIRLLRIINKIKKSAWITIIPTFLGAHTFPRDYLNKKDKYVDIIIKEMLPEVKREKLSRFCDIFCEEGAFNIEQTERIFQAARKMGYALRMHADQLSNSGASLIAAKYRCLSADHLDLIDEAGINALKKADVTAVLLPYATLFTGHKDYAPARKMIDRGLRVAISTDFNPGSSYTYNLFFCATLGITQMKMTIDEALMSITINPAYALGLQKKKGSIEIGKDADLIILKTSDYREIFYNPDPALIDTVIAKGNVIYRNKSSLADRLPT